MEEPTDEPTPDEATDEPTLAEKLDASVANYRATDEQFVQPQLEPGEAVQRFYPAARTGPHFFGLQALWGVPVLWLVAALVVPLSALAAALVVGSHVASTIELDPGVLRGSPCAVRRAWRGLARRRADCLG